jgi:hypothetical protein
VYIVFIGLGYLCRIQVVALLLLVYKEVALGALIGMFFLGKGLHSTKKQQGEKISHKLRI